MQHQSPAALKLIFVAVLVCIWHATAVVAAPDSAPTELTLKAGEIRLDGKIRLVDSRQNIFILDAASFTLPNGKTGKLTPAKPKIIEMNKQAVLHVRGDAGHKVFLADLKAGVFAIVTGKGAGSGQPLTAREVAVWDKVEAGQYSFGPRPIVAPGAEHPELALQLGHTSFVTTVVFSPDAKTLVSGSYDGTVRIWDVLTDELLWTLHGQSRPYFMADGKTLATFSNQNAMSVWDTHSGKSAALPQLQEALQQQKQNGVGASAFSPDGKTMALTTQSQIKILDAVTGQELKAIDTPNSGINSLLLAADGRTLVSRGGGEKVVKLWDVGTGALKYTLPYESNMGAMALASDGKTFATGSDESKVRLWSVETGTELRTFNIENRNVWSIAFSPDGKTLTACSGSSNLSLWDVKTGAVKRTLEQGMKGGIMSAAFAPRPVAGIDQLLACGSTYHITLWNAGSGDLKQTLHGRRAGDHTVLAMPGSPLLVSAGSGVGTAFWNVQTGELTWTLVEASSSQVALSGDGKLLVSLHFPNIKVWDAVRLKLLKEIQRENIYPLAMALSPDGSTLAIGSADNLVRLYDLEAGKLTRTLQGHTHWLHALSFAPDSKTLASAALDKTVRLWDVATGALKLTTDEGTWVYALAFSPDGKTVAAATVEGTIKLHDAATGGVLKTLAPLKRQSVSTIVFSPDGKWLASNSDGAVVLWDVETGEMRQTLAAAEFVRTIALSADGATIICGVGDGSIKVWDVKNGRVLATLLVLTNNYLDDLATDEWIAYTPEGYYQGSPNVARFIRWRVGDKLYPAAKFEKQFLRPDLVQKALRG